MTHTNKGFILTIGALIVAMLYLSAPMILKAATSYVSSQSTATATTTVTYMTAGTATTTYQLDGLASGKVQEMGEIDDVVVEVQMAASSTASTINIQPQVSNNNIDWYPINQVVGTVQNSGTSTLATSSTIYLWTPNTTATSSFAFKLPNTPARHERLVFTDTGASLAFYAEVTLKRLPTNP